MGGAGAVYSGTAAAPRRCLYWGSDYCIMGKAILLDWNGNAVLGYKVTCNTGCVYAFHAAFHYQAGKQGYNKAKD